MAMCIVYLEGQSYETVFDPVGLVVSRVEGVAILPILAALPHPAIFFAFSKLIFGDRWTWVPMNPPPPIKTSWRRPCSLARSLLLHCAFTIYILAPQSVRPKNQDFLARYGRPP